MREPVDTDAVLRWQRLWAIARGLPEAESLPGAVRVLYGKPHRKVEFLVYDPDVIEAVATLAEHEPATWVTVVTHEPHAVAARLTRHGLHVRSVTEALMGIQWQEHQERSIPDGYRIRVSRDGHVVKVSLADAADAVAAEGFIAVDGVDAVVDRVETDGAHRRRGLGGAVMSVLADQAKAHGARDGLLLATAEGERLYSGLGWRALSPVVVATSPE